MRWIKLPIEIALGLTMIAVCCFITGVLWLLEYEDKKNPASW